MISNFENPFRVDGICPYFTRFKIDFPVGILRSAETGEHVLDPFCGCGTTLFAARMAGLCGAGIDSNPVASVIARAKLALVRLDEVLERAAALLATPGGDERIPEGRFWERCFSPEILAALTRFRAHFSRSLKDGTDIFLAALVAGVMHGPSTRGERRYLSNHMPAAFAPAREILLEYWAAADLRPPRVNILNLIEQRARFILPVPQGPASGTAILGDSRDRAAYPADCLFDWIITSPPYLGLNTFVSDQWLRMWLLGDPCEVSGHIRQDDLDVYIRDLVLVWGNCAAVSRPGARLAIRFGTTSLYASMDPRALLELSLQAAEAGWHVDDYAPVREMKTLSPQQFPFHPPAERPLAEFILFGHLGT